ncbi:MAG: AAA family ATPase, partial [Clostridiales bacterium]|nr:AAA family ATPase [Clostridiales bacterium]
MQKILPIGIDSFREIREADMYYVDKTLIIRDFIQFFDKAALVTRPRRFGKTLNMTTIREFFDITAESKAIFEGLAIMGTQYAEQINSRPVLFFSFKDCKAVTAEEMLFQIAKVVSKEYVKYNAAFKGKMDMENDYYFTFNMIYEKLRNRNIEKSFLATSIEELIQTVHEHYKIKPIVLIDEYDQPIMSSVEHGYHGELKDFFAGFYGGALKGQDSLHRALLTGIQRIAKESIFSQLNNLTVYTVTDEPYSQHFGLTAGETSGLLSHYGLDLNDDVKQMYDGYLFGSTDVYNPWSVLNYAKTGALENYWIKTSANFLVHKSISEAGGLFRKSFDKLVAEGSAAVDADLTCSFLELRHRRTLWGLLINAGYLTVAEKLPGRPKVTVRIPNGEVRSEFVGIVADSANVDGNDLAEMFQCLFDRDMEGFLDVYQEIVLSCTSYFDAKENAYHMLFLGMCISL